MGDLVRHNERFELLKKLESNIPEEQYEIEKKMYKLMEIEQADTLVLVKISFKKGIRQTQKTMRRNLKEKESNYPRILQGTQLQRPTLRRFLKEIPS